ncbi:MAG: hypothetical protein EBU90_06370 [Proteobacteria bacterium]|nr:hypothetical protein [Pseudomonadota bacterium]
MKKVILKLKSYIYKYTGIYLAHKEENEFLTSDEFWSQLKSIFKNNKSDCFYSNPKNVQGLLVGMWQAKNGFSRFYNPFMLKTGFINKTINLFYAPLVTLKWDLKNLFLTLKKVLNKKHKINKKQKTFKKRLKYGKRRKK